MKKVNKKEEEEEEKEKDWRWFTTYMNSVRTSSLLMCFIICLVHIHAYINKCVYIKIIIKHIKNNINYIMYYVV